MKRKKDEELPAERLQGRVLARVLAEEELRQITAGDACCCDTTYAGNVSRIDCPPPPP